MQSEPPNSESAVFWRYGNIRISHAAIRQTANIVDSYSQSPPRIRAEPYSQPPSPNSTSSSPQRPTLLSTQHSGPKYKAHIVKTNKLVMDEAEGITQLRLTNGNCSWEAKKGRDLNRQTAILRALDTLSVIRLRKLAVVLVHEKKLIREWFERELDVESVDMKVIERVALGKLIELLVVLARENRLIRKFMVMLLLDKLQDGTFVEHKF